MPGARPCKLDGSRSVLFRTCYRSKLVMLGETEQEAYHELLAWTLSLRENGFIHQEVVDAWAAQHATEASTPISVGFALIGLYLYLEKGFSGRQVQRAHMQLAQPHGRGPGRKQWPRFPLPVEPGRITVSNVLAAPATERTQAIECWCRAVWEAWKDSHAAIAEWVRQDLGLPASY
jgi:Family of unknown function (DUF5946)